MKECALNVRRALTHRDESLTGWSEWMDIEQESDYEGFGVYKVRLVDPKEFPVNIPRFTDIDKEGILQICCSDNIKKGIYHFLRATEGKRYAHAEGKRVQLLKQYTNLEERYKRCKLQYSFKRRANRREARMEQERVMKCYFKKYGELPPNNNNFPDKYIDWESLPDDKNQPAFLPIFLSKGPSNP